MEDGLTRTIIIDDREIEKILTAHFSLPSSTRFDWGGWTPNLTITADLPPTEPAKPATNDSWIEWTGGEAPAAYPFDELVEVRLSDGELSRGRGSTFRWQHMAAAHGVRNIVAYRVI